MSDIALLVSGACVLVVMFILWRSGFWGARAYGNQLAKYLGVNKNLFHSALDLGTGNGTLMLLSTLKRQGMGHHQASVAIAPYLADGLRCLEDRFGKQALVEQAKPIVQGLLELHARSQ